MASPRAGREELAGTVGLREGLEGFVKRTECFNGFWDGVEGGLGGAVWLLLGRHCGWTGVVIFLLALVLALQWPIQQ